MELELNLFQPVRDILSVDTFNINRPLVSMVCIDAGGPIVGVKRLCDASEDWRSSALVNVAVD